MLRMVSPRAISSSWFRPEAGSSSKSSRGCATRPRAISTFFCTAKGSAPAGICATPSSPRNDSSSSARSRASRSLRPTQGGRNSASSTPTRSRQLAATSTLSSTVMVRNSSTFWKVRAMPTLPSAGRR